MTSHHTTATVPSLEWRVEWESGEAMKTDCVVFVSEVDDQWGWRSKRRRRRMSQQERFDVELNGRWN